MRSSRCLPTTCTCWGRWWAFFVASDETGRPQPNPRPGAARTRAGRKPRVPGVRRVRPAHAGGTALPRVRHAPGGAGPVVGTAATIFHAGRVTAGLLGLEESPDTAGQDAGEIPGGESRRKVAQKGDRLRRIPNLRRRRR